MSRRRVIKVWWVGYDPEAATYFADRDVDLFTSNVNIENFGRSVDQVLEQLRSTGDVVGEGRRTDQFARLHVQTMDGVPVDIDMGMDWRQADPVTLSIGPVLSLEDAIGNKVSAPLRPPGGPRLPRR